MTDKLEVKKWVLWKALALAIWTTEQEIKKLNYDENEHLLPDWITIRDRLAGVTESTKLILEIKSYE